MAPLVERIGDADILAIRKVPAQRRQQREAVRVGRVWRVEGNRVECVAVAAIVATACRDTGCARTL